MSTDRQIFLLGLPSTGKTSFLAALWYMVKQTTVECNLILDRLAGDSTYLNRISQAWLEYKPVPRTLIDSEKVISMSLKKRISGEAIRLTVPDISGESFRLQWTARQFAKSYDRLLREASGAILFVHPATIVKPHRIDEVDALVAAQQDATEEAGFDLAADTAGVVAKPWEIEKAATQVQLIELLQFISMQEYFRPQFKLAVVVSAWDLIAALGTDPAKWFSDQLPMLRQYLDSNNYLFQTCLYGLSAQGAQYPSWRFERGDIKNQKAFADRLVGRSDSVSRWLWEQFDESTQTALQARHTETPDSDFVEGSVIDRLNGLMPLSVFYEKDRFGSVQLRQETQELLGAKDIQKGDETIRLNRLLLEDAYPVELSRERHFDAAISELQRKLPARRVSLVGSGPNVSHDITEPVQWLMQ